MSVIGTGRKALHHTVQEPCETDTDSPADPPQRDTLAQQVFNQRALLVRNATVRGVSHKLTSARLAVMVLFGIVGMAIFLTSSLLTSESPHGAIARQTGST